ncbi:MAG: DNA-binding response OmpR family regulator [Planctomycetota bacterium]|jgi:DNA-binding response OmpR family regulator
MTRILIVDDDPKLRSVIQRGLAGHGIESEVASTGDEALARLADHDQDRFDLVLLDVMMPGVDGWEVLSQMRSRDDRTPAIFVTARDAVEERVKGLELGGDDYIIKPFDFSELLARIEAVLRRRETMPKITRGPLVIHLAERSVVIRGEKRELSSKEFDLLLALARADGAVVDRSELRHTVWGIDFDPETNVVDVFIARLRNRLRPYGARLIQTVRGQGYYLSTDDDE